MTRPQRMKRGPAIDLVKLKAQKVLCELRDESEFLTGIAKDKSVILAELKLGASALLLTYLPSVHVGQLTRRDIEIAKLVRDGLSNKEIAAHLRITVNTVAAHLKRMYRLLGVTSRATLAVQTVGIV